jgi:hypothetical protein
VKTLSTKDKLQLWHLILLFLVPVFYAILKLNSESHDSVTRFLGTALIVFGSIWSAYIVVMTVRYGNNENIFNSVLSEYRRQLSKYSFLIISNTVLTLAAVFLLYQLFFFRQVEFTSNADVRVMLVDTPGKFAFLGIVKEKQPIKYRLMVGTRQLNCMKLTDDIVVASEKIEVPVFWSDRKVPLVKIDVPEREYKPTSVVENQVDESVDIAEEHGELTAPISTPKQLKWGLESRWHDEIQAPAEFNAAMKIKSRKGERLYRYFMVSKAYDYMLEPVIRQYWELWRQYEKTLANGQNPERKEFLRFAKNADPSFIYQTKELAPVLYFDFKGKSNTDYILDSIIVKTIDFDEYGGGGFSDREEWYDIELRHEPGVRTYNVEQKLRFTASGRAQLRLWSDNYSTRFALAAMGCYMIDIQFNFSVDGETVSFRTGPFKIDV